MFHYTRKSLQVIEIFWLSYAFSVTNMIVVNSPREALTPYVFMHPPFSGSLHMGLHLTWCKLCDHLHTACVGRCQIPCVDRSTSLSGGRVIGFCDHNNTLCLDSSYPYCHEVDHEEHNTYFGSVYLVTMGIVVEYWSQNLLPILS